MKYYKGFNNDMTCLGFKYEAGKTYETDEAVLCESGFHACECPLDVLKHYLPVDIKGNFRIYREVELDEVSNDRDITDTKVCAKRIKIKAELNFSELAKAHVEWAKEQFFTTYTTHEDFSAAVSMHRHSAATATGCWSAAVTTEDYSAAINEGCDSASTCSGVYSIAANKGVQSTATCTSGGSVATNAGKCSVAISTGDRSAATNSGYRSAATCTGGGSVAFNTGRRSVAIATGNKSAATCTGEEAIAIAWGVGSKARAALGSYIVLAEYDKNFSFVGAKMGQIDGKVLKENVYYTLRNGEFVEED